LREEKNVGRLVRAFARLASSVPARLVVVGDGPQHGILVALATELGVADRVTFAGHQADTPGFYQGFDIFALSSDTEQMPLSVIEAMASGLPVVSTDVGDVRAMVAEQNAPYITALDDVALASSLQRLAADQALRGQIGAANREKAERDFDEATMFSAHGALWRGDAGRA
jgi:glycosyltransferase involved in cell wall biosynthesis